uniref:Uncharacterized protein n=1 Tax=Oryza sativa subsp. japonica TaxID=39947 RepID=Q69P29_ORYSJ|nr:hypothetical protein [Oryza sativa Japonica Group]
MSATTLAGNRGGRRRRIQWRAGRGAGRGGRLSGEAGGGAQRRGETGGAAAWGMATAVRRSSGRRGVGMARRGGPVICTY